MSGANFARSPSLTYNEVNTQKTLIYDLRSELSNLKNQFSRLISKPTDLGSKSKIDAKPGTKSRYSCVESDNSFHDSQISISSQCQISCKSTDIAPRLNLVRTETNLEHKNSQAFQRLTHVYRKNSNQQAITTINLPVANQPDRKSVDIKKIDGDNTPTSSVKKSPEFTTFYKKFHGSAYEAGEKVNTSSKLSNKTTEISSDAMNQSAFLDQLGAAQEKIKKLEQENKDYSVKNTAYAQQITQMQSKITGMAKQIEGCKLELTKKDESIERLSEQVRSLNLKTGKSNEQILQLNRQKIKQIQALKQSFANDLRNQQKEMEKKLSSEKLSSDSKQEAILKSLKQQHEAKILELTQQNENLKVNLSCSNQKLDSFKAEFSELDRKKSSAEKKLQESTNQINLLKQQVKCLTLKKCELEKIQKEKLSVERKEIGVNTVEQKAQVQPMKPALATISPPNQTNNDYEKQKQLQDKLANYLNNIDKQSQKIKEQKSEIEKGQRMIQDCNRAICEKDLVIRNLMRDCKVIEKDLIEHRRMRRELELLVEESNLNLSQLHLAKLNNKYKDL